MGSIVRLRLNYSQIARAYSFLILLSILSTFYWLKLQCNSSNKVKDTIKYTLIIILTAYIHYFGLLLVIIQLGYWVFHTIIYKKALKYPAFSIIALSLFYFPWALVMINSFSQIGGGNFWIQRPNLSLFLNHLGFIFNPGMVGLSLLAIAPLFINFSHHIKNLIKLVEKNFSLKSPIFALAFLILAMIIVTVLISFHTPILTNRNLLSITPIVIIFMSIWITLSAIKNSRVVSYVFFSCLLCLFLFLPKYYSTANKNPQWREAVLYVIEEASHDSVIISGMPTTVPSPTQEYSYAKMFNYYLRYFNYDTNKVYDDINGVSIDDVENFCEALELLEAKDLFILEGVWSWYYDDNILEFYKDVSKNYKKVNYYRNNIHHFTF